MTSRIRNVTFDCSDAYALSSFWANVLAYEPNDANAPGLTECAIVDGDGGHRLLFIEVPEAKQVKNRVHLDVVPIDQGSKAEIERVTELGASVIAEIEEPDEHWVVLADPEGNEFCIICRD
jgi:predicted enzyme related to lactoylglutathione lyase